MPRNHLQYIVRHHDFDHVNQSRHDKFQAKAPRTGGGRRYRIQLVLLRTTRVRNRSLGDLVEKYLQRAKLLLDEHDLDLRVVDLISSMNGLQYNSPLREPKDPSSGDLRPNVPGDIDDLLEQMKVPMVSLLGDPGVPQDESWLPVVFTPFDHNVVGVCPKDANACFVDSEEPGPSTDFGTVLHEVAHASGLPRHTNDRLEDGHWGPVAWPEGPRVSRRNILLTAIGGAPGAKRDGIDEETLESLFEAEFCQPPGVDKVGASRIV